MTHEDRSKRLSTYGVSSPMQVGRRPRSIKESSDEYRQFRQKMTSRYKICDHPEEKSTYEINDLLGMIMGNTSQHGLHVRKALYCFSVPLSLVAVGIPYAVYYKFSTKFRVPDCHFAMVEDRSQKWPKTVLYGPGYHFLGLYKRVQGLYSFGDRVPDHLYQSDLGDLTIIVVEQGTIARFEYNGQYEILGPGLHMTHDTVKFMGTVRLNNYFVKIGTEKWITVPDQYDGIAVDNGRTVILKGGKQYYLSHENFIFAKFVPKIAITDRVVTDISKYVESADVTLEIPTAKPGMLDPSFYLQVKTKDGATMFLDILLIWRILDTEKAATRAMEPFENRKTGMKVDNLKRGDDVSSQLARSIDNIQMLRKILIRIARGCVAEVVSQICLSEKDPNLELNLQEGQEATKPQERMAKVRESDYAALHFAVQSFLNRRAEELTQKINKEVEFYGAQVTKMTVNDAIPMPEVQVQLDRQVQAKISKNTAVVEAETKKQVAEEEVLADRIRKLGCAENELDAAKIAKV